MRPILSCQTGSGYHGVVMTRSQDSSNNGVRADMATAKRIKAFCDEARRIGALDAVVVSPQKVARCGVHETNCQ